MKVVFRPAKQGIEKILGALERSVLEVLWNKPALTGREVYEEVRGRKKVALTTVLTVLNRMVEKGSLRRKKKDGRYTYEAALGREEFERRVASAVVKGILEISPSQAIFAFVDVLSHWDEGQVDEIMKIINEKRKAEGR